MKTSKGVVACTAKSLSSDTHEDDSASITTPDSCNVPQAVEARKSSAKKRAADTARYEALAREHGADLGEEGFNEALKKVGRHKPNVPAILGKSVNAGPVPNELRAIMQNNSKQLGILPI